MLRIPSFHKGNAINRQYKNVAKSKAIVSGMAVTSFFVAARAAVAQDALPTMFFGASTCLFAKRRKELSWVESQLRPEFVKILKRLLRFKEYKLTNVRNKIDKLQKGEM